MGKTCQKVGNESKKIQGTSTSVKFSGVWWYRTCGDVTSKAKDKLLHVAPTTSKKRGTMPSGPP